MSAIVELHPTPAVATVAAIAAIAEAACVAARLALSVALVKMAARDRSRSGPGVLVGHAQIALAMRNGFGSFCKAGSADAWRN